MKDFVLLAFVCLLFLACNSDKELQQLQTISPSATDRESSAVSLSPTGSPQRSSPTKSPTPPPTAKPEVIVTESGFNGYEDTLGNNVVVWAAVVQNTSPNQQVLDAEVTALFYDAANVLLDSDKQTVRLIFPAQVAAAGSTYVTTTSQPARMEVRISGGDFQTPDSTNALTVSEASLSIDRFSSAVIANITNPFAVDFENLQITCIVSDSNGAYLGVGQTFLELLPAGATAQGNCSLDSRLDLSSAAVQRMFAGFSFITDLSTPGS